MAISYDSEEILKSFSDRQGGIHYSMLADDKSEIIKAFGLMNPNIEPGSMQYGMAFPGIYIVDANGIVQEKVFNESYRQRMTAQSVLSKLYGAGEAGGLRVEADVKPQFKLTAFPSQETLSGGHRIFLLADFELYDKVHLYAPGSSYRAVDIKIADNPALLAGELGLPEPEMIYLEAINETVPVYHGKVRVNREVTLSPHYQGSAITIDAILEYQTCDDELCYPPDRMPISFELEVVALDRVRAPEGVRHPGGGGGKGKGSPTTSR